MTTVELPSEPYSITPDLIITGVMEGDRFSTQRPKLIELKAMRDIPDINVYRIKVNGLSQNLYNEVAETSQ